MGDPIEGPQLQTHPKQEPHGGPQEGPRHHKGPQLIGGDLIGNSNRGLQKETTKCPQLGIRIRDPKEDHHLGPNQGPQSGTPVRDPKEDHNLGPNQEPNHGLQSGTRGPQQVLAIPKVPEEPERSQIRFQSGVGYPKRGSQKVPCRDP